jgi:hypothetical protein
MFDDESRVRYLLGFGGDHRAHSAGVKANDSERWQLLRRCAQALWVHMNCDLLTHMCKLSGVVA